MKHTLKKLENKNLQLTLELDLNEWNKLVDESYNKNKGKFKIEGFRAGKAPRKIIEGMYGPEVFFEDAIADGFNRYYNEILDKDKAIEPIDGPELRVEKLDANGIVIVAEIPVKPEVTLGAYTGLNIDVKAKEITDKDVTAELKNVQKQNARLVEKEGEIVKGDIANIDFKGSVDGEYFEGGTAEGFDLEIGSKSFIDTFEDQLIGVKAGEEKDVLVTFPKNYHAENLKGKPAKFEVKVNAVKTKELPKIDDEFASNVSEFETLEEYKKHIKEHLEEHAAEDAKIQTENQIIDKILEGMTVDIPNVMVERELDGMMKDMEYRLMYQGATLEQYAEYTNQTVEKIRESGRESAVKSVKIRLALQEIVKKEKIKVTEKDVDKYIADVAKKANKTVEEYKSLFTGERLSYVQNELLMNKLLEFLIKNNK